MSRLRLTRPGKPSGDTVIKLVSINKSFGDQVLFEGLTFNVNARERIGLVGRNGHGKTTLFRIILGALVPDSGEVLLPKRYRLGHLDQELRFTRATVVEEATMGLQKQERDHKWKAEAVLAGLGFTPDDMAKPPVQLSGGFQVRLNLAKTLLSSADLLLLDEPTNYLDVVSIRWLGRFLRTWPGELILITHDRAFMDSVVTHSVAIHRRRAKKITGGTEKLYSQILQEEEIYEKTRINDERKRQEIERFVTRFRAKNSLATRVQSRIRYLAKHERLDKLERIETLDFSFNHAMFPAKVMMRAEDLSFGYDAGPDLFHHLSFEIQAHDRICVIGPNGKGKSTLMRVLAGELSPRTGCIDSHPRTRQGYFAQTNLKTLTPHNTVVEEILTSGDCLPQTARNVAGAMMFEGDHALKKISVLSGGEKSRVMLAKLIVAPGNLLLLDEPTNHLDMDSCDSLLAAIDEFEGAVVLVTHNEMFLHALATRFIVFDRGEVRVFEGAYQDFLDRVGWETDDPPHVAGRGRTIARPAPDKKRLRQQRAKIIQERSRIVTPLQQRVEDLESRIMDAESEAATTVGELEAASVRGDAEQIANLSRRSQRLASEIDGMFSELETATRDLQHAEADFDRRLSQLEST